MFGFFKKRKQAKFQEFMKDDALLLDVRTTEEYSQHHIPKSKNLPAHLVEEQMSTLDKDQPLIVYCAMGGRSAIAAAKLKAKGFKTINAGGIKSVESLLENR